MIPAKDLLDDLALDKKSGQPGKYCEHVMCGSNFAKKWYLNSSKDFLVMGVSQLELGKN